LSCLCISYVCSIATATHVAFLATTTHIYFRIGISSTSISNSSTIPRLGAIWNLIFPFPNVLRISTVHHWCSIILWRVEIIRIVNLNHIYLSFIPIMSSFWLLLLLLMLRSRCFSSWRACRSQKLLRWIISNNNVFLRNTTVAGNFSGSSVMIWTWVGLSGATRIWMF